MRLKGLSPTAFTRKCLPPIWGPCVLPFWLSSAAATMKSRSQHSVWRSWHGEDFVICSRVGNVTVTNSLWRAGCHKLSQTGNNRRKLAQTVTNPLLPINQQLLSQLIPFICGWMGCNWQIICALLTHEQPENLVQSFQFSSYQSLFRHILGSNRCIDWLIGLLITNSSCEIRCLKKYCFA